MELITKLKGTNGIILLYVDRIVISRKTFGGIASFGIVGDRSIFYNSIQGVEYSGSLLKIIPKGIETKGYNNLKYSDIKKAQRDENVILLSPFNKKIAEKIYQIINAKVNETYNGEVRKENYISSADEIRKYKQLLDEGIITQEEFEKKKNELL